MSSTDYFDLVAGKSRDRERDPQLLGPFGRRSDPLDIIGWIAISRRLRDTIERSLDLVEAQHEGRRQTVLTRHPPSPFPAPIAAAKISEQRQRAKAHRRHCRTPRSPNSGAPCREIHMGTRAKLIKGCRNGTNGVFRPKSVPGRHRALSRSARGGVDRRARRESTGSDDRDRGRARAPDRWRAEQGRARVPDRGWAGSS